MLEAAIVILIIVAFVWFAAHAAVWVLYVLVAVILGLIVVRMLQGRI